MSSPEFNAVLADPNGACDRIEELEEALRELYEFCSGQNEIRMDSRVMRKAHEALSRS